VKPLTKILYPLAVNLRPLERTAQPLTKILYPLEQVAKPLGKTRKAPGAVPRRPPPSPWGIKDIMVTQDTRSSLCSKRRDKYVWPSKTRRSGASDHQKNGK